MNSDEIEIINTKLIINDYIYVFQKEVGDGLGYTCVQQKEEHCKGSIVLYYICIYIWCQLSCWVSYVSGVNCPRFELYDFIEFNIVRIMNIMYVLTLLSWFQISDGTNRGRCY